MTAPYIASAVRQQRMSRPNTPDFFPTPPWATRALFKHVIGPSGYANAVVWEPACGAGDMARALAEYALEVTASDTGDYGYGHSNINFLTRYCRRLSGQCAHAENDWGCAMKRRQSDPITTARRRDKDERETESELIDTYMVDLGDFASTPLAQANMPQMASAARVDSSTRRT